MLKTKKIIQNQTIFEKKLEMMKKTLKLMKITKEMNKMEQKIQIQKMEKLSLMKKKIKAKF